MSVKFSWVSQMMEDYAPSCLAMEWDNVGFLVGETNESIEKILVALDLNDEVLEEAIGLGADLIITHHPVIFKPMKRITDESSLGRRIIRLLKNNIAVYAAHTNLDMANGGTNDVLFDTLGLVNKQPLEESHLDGFSLGRVGDLPQTLTLEELCHMVKRKLSLAYVNCAGDHHTAVKRVALCTGSSAEVKFFRQAVARGCQVYITGDVTYHMAQAALEMGLCLIDATHYGTETIVSQKLCDYLMQRALDNGYTVATMVSKTNGQTFDTL